MTPSSARILVVEDEQIVTLDLTDTLRELGHTVVGTTGRGDEAIALAAALEPDLVLMDVHLGSSVDGVSAAAAMRRAGGPPVVFITAYDDEEMVARAKLSEPYGYLLKPFNVRELRVAIQMALFHHVMQRERAELTRQLQAALQEVTQLKSLLHMCAYCRRVADDHGRWESFEAFLGRHTGTLVSHGMCPDCYARVMAAGFDEPGTAGNGP
jgi:CheY-like chemotaxis protein